MSLSEDERKLFEKSLKTIENEGKCRRSPREFGEMVEEIEKILQKKLDRRGRQRRRFTIRSRNSLLDQAAAFGSMRSRFAVRSGKRCREGLQDLWPADRGRHR